MQARDDGGRVDEADDDVADAQGYLEQEVQQTEDGVLEPDEDGSYEEDRDVGGDRDGHERRHEEVEHLGYSLMQAFLHEAQDPDAHEYGDDVSLVAYPVDAVEARYHRERDHRAVGEGLGGAVGADEVGADEQGTERCAKVGVAPKDCGCREAEQDLQVCQGAGVDERRDAPPYAGGVQVKEARAVGGGRAHELDGTHDAHEHAGCDDGGDDGDEDVREYLDGLHEAILLLGGRLLDVGLARGGDVALLAELVVDLVDGTRPIDDLELTRSFKVALGANGVIDLLLVDLGVVRDDQAQACGAVRCRNDVARAADRLQNLLSGLCVIKCH